jgi:hypothetical protein
LSSKIKATLSGNFALVLSNDIDLAAEFDPAARMALLSKKRSKKELTKRPPFLVKSLVCKSSEKTVNGGWRDGRTLEPF